MPLDDVSEALKIWDSLKPMIDTEIANKTQSCVRMKKMNVVTAPNGTTIGVQDPFDTTVLNIPYSSAVSNASVGGTVWVQWYFDNASTMIAVSHGNGSIQGFLPLSGGTLTGDLTIAKTQPAIYLKKTHAGEVVGGLYHVVDSGSNNRTVLLQRVDGSAGAEGFFLPTPDTHAAFTTYGILTSKNAVTVAQGGTGATTAADARTNLGVNTLIDKDGNGSATWVTQADTYLQSGANDRSMTFYRRGKIVIVNARLNLNTASTGSAFIIIGTMPSGFKANGTYYQAVPIQATTQMATISVDSDGDICLYHNNTSSGFMRFTMTYPLKASDV